jgi:hypothetical protein
MKIDITTPPSIPLPHSVSAPTTKSCIGPASAIAGHPCGRTDLRGRRSRREREEAQPRPARVEAPTLGAGQALLFHLRRPPHSLCSAMRRRAPVFAVVTLPLRGSTKSVGARDHELHLRSTCLGHAACPGRPRAKWPWRRQVRCGRPWLGQARAPPSWIEFGARLG